MSNFKPRWYGADVLLQGQGRRWSGIEQQGVVGDESLGRVRRLPEELLRLAQDEYDIQHPGQPYERMQQRGGLGLVEMILLLADALERAKDASDYYKGRRSVSSRPSETPAETP